VQEALNLFQTNFFGVHRMVRAVLPTMPARKAGRLVTIGSVAGFLSTPFEAFYSASSTRSKAIARAWTLRSGPSASIRC
jgi:short-subunit dehydrogenase